MNCSYLPDSDSPMIKNELEIVEIIERYKDVIPEDKIKLIKLLVDQGYLLYVRSLDRNPEPTTPNSPSFKMVIAIERGTEIIMIF